MFAPAPNAIARHKTATPPDPDGWYVEEPFAVHCLLDVLAELGLLSPGRPGTILDPCAGMGTIPAACRARGLVDVTAADLRDRGFPGVAGGIDFLGLPAYPPGSFDWVISNPPYFGGAGVLRALERAVPVARDGVALLVNVPFLASQERCPVFNGQPAPGCSISDVVILSMRPSMPPGTELAAGRVKQTGGKEDYCWVIWRHGHGARHPTIHWRLPRPEHTPPNRGKRRKAR
ncbi:hypothetical protein [Azospirillum sp. A39]|uniref:hypothetical protein n=1 Tax=Azospirillum sp. A39 TaxID=3462279 RepID=UPI0040452543